MEGRERERWKWLARKKAIWLRRISWERVTGFVVYERMRTQARPGIFVCFLVSRAAWDGEMVVLVKRRKRRKRRNR